MEHTGPVAEERQPSEAALLKAYEIAHDRLKQEENSAWSALRTTYLVTAALVVGAWTLGLRDPEITSNFMLMLFVLGGAGFMGTFTYLLSGAPTADDFRKRIQSILHLQCQLKLDQHGPYAEKEISKKHSLSGLGRAAVIAQLGTIFFLILIFSAVVTQWNS